MSMIRNGLAVIGLFSLIVIVAMLVKVDAVFDRVNSFDEHSVDIFSSFLEQVYDSGSVIDAMVYKVAVQPGLTSDEVDLSIRNIANELNIKNVGELALSEEVESITGKPYRFIKIYLLCNAMTAASILNYNDAFSSILPCRLSLVEDEQGKLWIYTLDLDLVLQGGEPMPPALKAEAIKVRDTLKQIMHRSAVGDF